MTASDSAKGRSSPASGKLSLTRSILTQALSLQAWAAGRSYHAPSARLRRKGVGSAKSTSLKGKWILSPKIDWREALARFETILVAT